MTFSHKQASEQIAQIYKLKSSKIHIAIEKFIGDELATVEYSKCYITQDLGALMELAIRNGISVFSNDISKDCTCSYWDKSNEYIHSVIEPYNNDPIEATRVAIARALIKKGGE